MNQKGFAPILILLGIVLVIVISGGTYYLGTKKTSVSQPQIQTQNPVETSQTPQPTTTPNFVNLHNNNCSSQSGATSTGTAIQSSHVDPSVAMQAHTAFIAKGFTSPWLDQHSHLVNSETHVDVSEDPSTNWKPQNETVTVLTYQVCVYGYSFFMKYDHSDDGKLNSFAEIYAPTHDINQVIPPDQAKIILSKCGSVVGNSNVVFQDIEDQGALFPGQTRLYLQGPILKPTSQSSSIELTTAVQGGKGGIVTSSTANVDLETGKCFVTSHSIAI